MDAAAERLIHSVNAVTDLLKANTSLRDNIERMQRDLDDKDAEGFQLQIENQALRERLELVEGILKNNSQNYDELVSAQIRGIMEKSNTEFGKVGAGGDMKNIDARVTTVDQVYTELIQLRNKNRALEGRIKQLENQNFSITQQNFTANLNLKKQSTKNMEPSRPHFDPMGRPTIDPNARGSEESKEQFFSPHSQFMQSETEEQKTIATNRQKGSQQLEKNTSRKKLESYAKPVPLLNNIGFQSDGLGQRKQTSPVSTQMHRPQHQPNLSMQYGNRTDPREFHDQGTFHPVPDDRYYTKANFFSLRNKSRDGVVSEQYQTDADPTEQVVFEEMMHRRSQIGQGVVQAPAVPGQHSSYKGEGLQQAGGHNYSQTRSRRGPDGQQIQLQTIIENEHGGFMENHHSLEPGMYPMPMGSRIKKKNFNKQSQNTGSLVVGISNVSNVMTKRKFSRKKGLNSKFGSEYFRANGVNYHHNDFYF